MIYLLKVSVMTVIGKTQRKKIDMVQPVSSVDEKGLKTGPYEMESALTVSEKITINKLFIAEVV